MSWGLKLHRFRFLSKENDTTKIDKNSFFLVPFLAQSLTKGKFSYHLYFSIPLGGESSEDPLVETQDAPTLVFVSGFEYLLSKHVKFILEYYFTNLYGFLDIRNNEGRKEAWEFNETRKWISYMFLGSRISFGKRFYSELGISTHYSIPPFPLTGLVLNFGWYFR
jgi:hypothetical protein